MPLGQVAGVMAAHERMRPIVINALLLNHMISVSIINPAFQAFMKTDASFMNRLDRAVMIPLIKNLNAEPVLPM